MQFFCLRVTNFTEVKPDNAGTKVVRLWLPAVLFEGSTESADEGSLGAGRGKVPAGSGGRRKGRAAVYFGLPKLVPQEL